MRSVLWKMGNKKVVPGEVEGLKQGRVTVEMTGGVTRENNKDGICFQNLPYSVGIMVAMSSVWRQYGTCPKIGGCEVIVLLDIYVTWNNENNNKKQTNQCPLNWRL